MPITPAPHPNRNAAQVERNRGLDRIRQLTRWTAVGGLALTGGFSVLAASGFTGHASGASTRPRTGFVPVLPGTSPTTKARPTTTVPPATAPGGNGSNATQPPQTAAPTTATTQPYVYVPDTTYYPPVTQSSGS